MLHQQYELIFEREQKKGMSAKVQIDRVKFEESAKVEVNSVKLEVASDKFNMPCANSGHGRLR
jgi:hypothetical protein